MIPEFDKHGNLKPGIWNATIAEVEERFAQTPLRRRLFEALLVVVEILTAAKCPAAYLDGSFITTASEPGDYDLCYESTGMVPTEEWRLFLKLTADERKKEHLGDIFVRMQVPPFFTDHVELWQSDRDGNVKGIIRIELRQQSDD